ncbi:MAG TPA: hypothetical protein VH134_10305 [Candidatus Dormibacteraeota bacterium]|jgi:uncharacterized membrane protein|nr:hypothetical protein [Candidatus Dormibacteraeota bacterium]
MALTLVRFLHYTSGIAWVGATLVLSLVVFPAIDRCPGNVRAPVMRALARRIAPWETAAATAVIASGGLQAWLQHRLDGGLGSALGTRWGMAIGTGLACAVLLVVLGLSTLAPLARRFSDLEDAVAHDPARSALGIRELGRVDPQWWDVRRRLVLATLAEIVLALVAVGAMAVARGS